MKQGPGGQVDELLLKNSHKKKKRKLEIASTKTESMHLAAQLPITNVVNSHYL